MQKTLLKKARELCRENGVRLLYLTLFGSRLYGTAGENSDLDARGIFLPSQDQLALLAAPRSLHFSTGEDDSRNSAGDIDIDLWSLQHWLLHLLPAGDTSALDLLFSPSNRACVLFQDPLLDTVFANPEKLIDCRRGQAWLAYAIGQAKKYGIKGSRLGAVRAVAKWLEGRDDPAHTRLGELLPALLAACGDEKYCARLTTKTGEEALQLAGKLHMASTRLGAFRERVAEHMARYGTRAAEAELNQGVDFKALSHAMRAFDQMEELLRTGRVVYPLKTAGRLKAIKRGDYAWSEAEPLLLERQAQIEALQRESPCESVYDPTFASAQVLACCGPVPARAAVKAASSPVSDFLQNEVFREIMERRGVRILYACESGSRAWGFPSRDSDFDVRFLYAETPDWHLRLEGPKKDTIEWGITQTPAGVLDVCGWEIRKALDLLRKSNAALIDWLGSPEVYYERNETRRVLRQSMEAVFNPLALWHHYAKLLGNMRKTRSENVKGILYACRALLCLLWLERFATPPPTPVRELARALLAPPLQTALEEAIALKRDGLEHDAPAIPPAIEAWLGEEAARIAAAAPRFIPRPPEADLDAVFRHILKTTWGSAWPQG